MSKELSRLKIKAGPGSSHYDLLTNTIYIGAEQIEAAESIDDIIDVINHEMQHAVQRNFGAREDTRDIPLREKALDLAHRYTYARSEKNPTSIVPIVERDAVFLQKDPTKGSWYKKMTPAERAVYMDNVDDNLNKSYLEFKKTIPNPDIRLGRATYYSPRKNKLILGERDITFEKFLDMLNHELQHYAQTMELSENELNEMLEAYKNRFYNIDIPLIEYDAIQSESEPFLSAWGKLLSEEQADKLSRTTGIPNPLDEINMKKAFLIYKTTNPPNIKLSNPLEPSEGMYYNLKNNDIVIGERQKTSSYEDILNSILHETQHWAQNTELDEDEQERAFIGYMNARRKEKLPFVEFDATMAENKLNTNPNTWVESASPEQYKKLIEHFNIQNPMSYEDVKLITIKHILNKIKEIDSDFLPKNYENNLIENLREGVVSYKDARIDLEEIYNRIRNNI